MHQVAQRLADEGIAVVVGRQEAAALDQRPATGVEERDRLAIEPRLRRADREDPAAVGHVEDRRHRRGLGQVGIAVQCLLLEHDVADRDRVPRREAVPPIVVRQAELAEAGDRLDRRKPDGDRPSAPNARSHEGETESRGGGSRPPAGRLVRHAHLAIAPAVGDVDPVVQAPGQAVDPELGVPLAESGQDDRRSSARPSPSRSRRNQMFGAAVTSTPP